MIKMLNNTVKKFSPSGYGDRSKRYAVRLQFSNVDEDFFNKLMVIYNWQERGYRVNLHLMDNFPDLPVPFIQGFMELTDIKKTIWDRSRISFTLAIEGAE